MSNLSGFSPVVSLMHTIVASGNKFPKVKLDIAGETLTLTVAGDRARHPGSINLTDGARYPENKFFGRITTSGQFEPGNAARRLDPAIKAALWNTLTRMRDGQAEQVFAESGKRVGACCMCSRPLSNDESVALGIGPVCRARAFG